MANIEHIQTYKHIHMLGIGGVSMSGIAEILHHFGIKVTGSDANSSSITNKLIEHGILVTIGHDFENIAKADAIVYTAAISKEDPELQEAKKHGIPCIERSDFLGELTKAFSNTIGIAGTHGKTTTTSMISICFVQAGKDPNIQVGGFLPQIDGNYRIGNSDYFIIEACEYVESFLKFRPKTEIILNIDNDHLDYFHSFDHIQEAFQKYVRLLPKNGFLVLNGDDKNCLALLQVCPCAFATYGIENQDATYVAKNITYDDNGFARFDVYKNHIFFCHFSLSVAGKHNVLNALSCIAVCDHYGISSAIMKEALLTFTGAHRRLEYKGSIHDIAIYDDYAHHPTEIKATYNALHYKKFHESWVVFQPHTYSRTKHLLNDFAEALSQFDHVIVTDIYAARESNTYGVSSCDIANRLNSSRSSHCMYISDFEEIKTYLHTHAKPKDIIVTLGAGNITDLGPMLLES